MQSLRQQLAEVERKQASSSTRSDDLARLQAEVGRLKTEVKKKVGVYVLRCCMMLNGSSCRRTIYVSLR